jgi:hypothetical protein
MIVIASKPGQLGNRIIVYAHFIAFAIEHELAICNPAFDEYSNYFIGSSSNIIARYPHGDRDKKRNRAFQKYAYKLANYAARLLHKLGIKSRHLNYTYIDWDKSIDLETNKEAVETLNSRLCFVLGWQYRSDNYARKHIETVRQYFTPIPKHAENIAAFLKAHKENHDVLIGVHIRRGDYKIFQDGKYYYTDETYISIQMKKWLLITICNVV